MNDYEFETNTTEKKGMLGWILGGVAVLAAGALGVGAILYNKKKKQQEAIDYSVEEVDGEYGLEDLDKVD